MRRPLALVLPLTLAALLSGGCLNFTNVIKLKASGAGTLETTVEINTAVFKQIGTMMGGGEMKGESKSSLPTADSLAADLSKVKGLRLVSQKEYKQGDVEGVKVLMAFDDINQVALDENLPGGKKKATRPEDQVKFSLAKQAGGTSLLAISFPDKPGDAVQGDVAKKAEGGSGKAPGPEVLQMLSGFFKGMRILIAVDVDGTLVRSSSPYVDGNRVTLLDINMEELLKDPSALQKMNGLPFGPDMSVTTAREAMAKAGVKGIKVNDPNITIELK
jgi:hypothetical protein